MPTRGVLAPITGASLAIISRYLPAFCFGEFESDSSSFISLLLIAGAHRRETPVVAPQSSLIVSLCNLPFKAMALVPADFPLRSPYYFCSALKELLTCYV
jgi:hypothetical protein